MTRIDTYPPGVPCFVEAFTADLSAARRFYEGIFGWEFAGPGPMPTDPPGEYWVARVDGADVAGLGSQPRPDTPAAWNTLIAVTNVDASVAAARAAGGSVVVDAFDVPPVGRQAVVADPAGAVVNLWQAGARQGAQLVNAPSAWAMSALTTADLDTASAFYADLLGWRAEAMDDAGEFLLMRLPGYVGGTESQPVPRDVVAAIMRLPDGAPGPSWNVDFWIADADAAAAAAPGLGGTVVAAPHDAPPFRRAVLAAPDGAAFSVSELRPAG